VEVVMEVVMAFVPPEVADDLSTCQVI